MPTNPTLFDIFVQHKLPVAIRRMFYHTRKILDNIIPFSVVIVSYQVHGPFNTDSEKNPKKVAHPKLDKKIKPMQRDPKGKKTTERNQNL